MSVRRLAEDQPESFAFTPENQAWAESEIAKYPAGRQASAVISLLWRAQKQHDTGCRKPAIEKVADMLGMPYIRVLEVATFYTMFNLEPVGTSPRPALRHDALHAARLRRHQAVLPQRASAPQRTGHGRRHVLLARGRVPRRLLQRADGADQRRLLRGPDAENFEKLLDDLAAGRPVKTGSQTGRASSEPQGGPLTALTTLYGGDGKSGPASVKG